MTRPLTRSGARLLFFSLFVLASGVGACRSTEKIGVAECDDYLSKAEACAKKGGVGEALFMSNDMLAKSWKKAAVDPATRATLANTCKAALEGAKKAYTTCAW